MDIYLDLLPGLLRGTLVTIQLALYSTAFGAVLAFASGIGKLSRYAPVRWLSVTYVEIFRGTSLLVQMFWLFFALPLLGVRLDPMTAGVLALSLNIGAYGAEVIRGALQSVPQGQREAVTALNLGSVHSLWSVYIPQALPEMMPPFGNLVVQNVKNTALVSLITLMDLTFAAQNLRNITFQTVPIYTLTLLMYFVLSLIFIGLMRWLEVVIRRRTGNVNGRAS